MRAFTETGAIDVPPKALAMIRQLFVGAGVSEADTSRAILSTLNSSGELIDPHTAVGVAAAHRMGSVRKTTPMVVLSTAHAAKFPESVEAAAGVAPAMPQSARGLAGRPERIDRLPADLEAVKTYIRDFAQR
jgi:threonine synthase